MAFNNDFVVGKSTRPCDICKTQYLVTSRVQKYCKTCADNLTLERSREAARRSNEKRKAATAAARAARTAA